MDRSRSLILLGVLLAVTTSIYACPLHTAPFVYEDAHVLEQLQGPLRWRIPSRVLTQWTYQQTGTDASAAHLMNLALHLGNGALVYALGSILASPAAGLGAAAIFLLHPLNTEAVSYVTARTELLATFFILLAVWLTLRWSDAAGMWRLGLAGVALIGAAMSKEIGLLATPLVVLTLVVSRRGLPGTTLLLNGLWCALGVVVGATWWQLASWFDTGVGSLAMDWPTFALLQLTAVWQLLTLVIWPVGFSIDHDIVGLSLMWRLLSGGATLAALTLCAWAWRRAPLIAWSMGWVAMCIAPRFVFATSEFIHEYQFYPAMAGLCVGLGALLAWRPRSATSAVTYPTVTATDVAKAYVDVIAQKVPA